MAEQSTHIYIRQYVKIQIFENIDMKQVFSCLFDEEHCSQFFLWSIWYLSFRIYFFIVPTKSQKPTMNFNIFVTGVKHTSRRLLRPWFNAVQCRVTYPSIIHCENAVQGFSDTIKNPVDDSAKTKLKCWEFEQYGTLKRIAVQSRGVYISLD